MSRWLNRFFEIESRRSTIARETRGAFATFFTMAYILAANPAILQNAGIPFDAAVCGTALAAGICCLLMGFVANFPIALASGMGLNALVAFTITPQTGSWQIAMGLVVLDGLIILGLVLLGLREAMLDAIPIDLRRGLAAGIGLFIALLGFVNSGIVVSSGLPMAPLKPGLLTDPTVFCTLGGVVVIAVLMVKRVPGAILIGIAATAVCLHQFDTPVTPDRTEPVAESANTSAEPTTALTAATSPESSRGLTALIGQADLAGALSIQFLPLLLTLVMVDFFDTLGTVTAISGQAGLIDENEQVPRLRRILVVDSLSAAIGGFLGVSSVTSYIESAVGVSEGARTGLHSVIVGLLFLLSLFAAPYIALVPPAATAPALIVIGFLMAESLTRIDFSKSDSALAAFVTLALIPMTYSISHGLGFGVLTLTAIRLLTGRGRELHPLLYAASVVFAVAFLLGS